MKNIIQRLSLLVVATITMTGLFVAPVAIGVFSNNDSAIYAVEPGEEPDTTEEGLAACYDRELYQDIPIVDTNLPTNPLKWFMCSVGQYLMTATNEINLIAMRMLFFDPTRNKADAESFYGDSCEYVSGDSNCASTVGIEEEGLGLLRETWGNVLTLANIVLVIGFLIIVISTALDLGIFSNYTVKKMLPRIIIAAIAANLSWGISSILIQLTNFIGLGISDLLTAPFTESLQQTLTQGGAAGGSQEGTGAVLIVALAVLMNAIWASGGALLLVALAVVGTVVAIAFLVIMVRRVILTLLVVVAPFAFILWALPGGEGLFKKWWKLFTQMLFLFPVIMVLFSAGIIVAALAGDVGAFPGDGAFQNIATSLIALISIVIPYAMIPLALKMSSGVLGNIANIANDKTKGAIDRSRQWGGVGNRKNIRAADKELKKGLRGQNAQSEALQRRARRAGRSGPLGVIGRRGVPKDELDLLQSQAAEDKVRKQAAEERGLKAQRAGHTLDVQKQVRDQQADLIGKQYKDHTGAVRTHDASSARSAALQDLVNRASDVNTDQEEYFAIMQELGRQKATSQIGQVQTNLALAGQEGANRWNAGVADNEVFAATTALDKGFGQSINPAVSAGAHPQGLTPHQQVAQVRLNTFMGKNLQARAGDQADAWKEAVHAAVSTGDLASLNKIYQDLANIEANDNLNGGLNIDTSTLQAYENEVTANLGTPDGASKYDPSNPNNNPRRFGG